jgi:hypothetical protein
MAKFGWLISLVVVLAAGGYGWLTAREYKAPSESGMPRLQERALLFYRASSRFDYETMARLYTPAEQQANKLELNKLARRWKQSFENEFEESHRNDLIKTAEALNLEQMEFRMEDDWALVKGRHDIYVEGKPVSMALEPSVWMCSGGDWWMYQLSDAELIAYGNPPDFARQAIFKREFQETSVPVTSHDVEQERELQIEEQRRIDALESPKVEEEASDK